MIDIFLSKCLFFCAILQDRLDIFQLEIQGINVILLNLILDYGYKVFGAAAGTFWATGGTAAAAAAADGPGGAAAGELVVAMGEVVC